MHVSWPAASVTAGTRISLAVRYRKKLVGEVLSIFVSSKSHGHHIYDTYNVCAYTTVWTPSSWDSVGAGPLPAPFVGSLAARSNVTKIELVNGETSVDVCVMIVS